MSRLSTLYNPFPGPHARYDLSTELSPALYLSIPIGPLHRAAPVRLLQHRATAVAETREPQALITDLDEVTRSLS